MTTRFHSAKEISANGTTTVSPNPSALLHAIAVNDPGSAWVVAVYSDTTQTTRIATLKPTALGTVFYDEGLPWRSQRAHQRDHTGLCDRFLQLTVAWVNYSRPADPAIGAAIREKRQARGWSLPRLAIFTGLNPDYLRDIEKSRGRPTDATLESILEVLADRIPKPATHRQRKLLRLAAKLELITREAAPLDKTVPLPRAPTERQEREWRKQQRQSPNGPAAALSEPVANYASPNSTICPRCQLPKVVQLPAGHWCEHCRVFLQEGI